MKKAACAVVLICLLLFSIGCGADNISDNAADIENGEEATESLLQKNEGAKSIVQTEVQMKEPYTTDTRIADVISDPVFGEYVYMLFYKENDSLSNTKN